MSNSSQNKTPELDESEKGLAPPRMSEDSQAFIGLKLRELYDDVVAEPVPDRILELLDQLGGDDNANASG